MVKVVGKHFIMFTAMPHCGHLVNTYTPGDVDTSYQQTRGPGFSREVVTSKNKQMSSLFLLGQNLN